VSEENDEPATFAGGSGVSRRAVVWTVVALVGAFVPIFPGASTLNAGVAQAAHPQR
jgi:hypothetical protein